MTLTELNIEKVPSVPQVLLELLNLFHQPDPDFGRISEVIEQDAAITAKVLHFAKTPFYRPWARVESVRRLIVVLGADQIRQIALTSAIHQYFSNLSPDYDGFVDTLWARSLFCGHLAGELAELTGGASREDAYTAGLLHRIGQLLLLHNHPEKYLDVLFMDAPDSLREQTERGLFSTCHSEVGATLIRSWPLHPFVADAVLYQNAPQETLKETSALVRLLNLAVRLTDSTIRGSADEFDWNDPLFGLNAALLKEVVAESRNVVVDAGNRFGIEVERFLGPDRALPKKTENQGRREKHPGLACYVQQAALTGSSQAVSAPLPGKKEALQRARQELAIVFGLHGIRFLLCDEEKRQLSGVSEENDPVPFAELSLNLRDSASLAAQALHDNVPHCTLDQPAAPPSAVTIDQQIARLLDSEGALFLPLTDGTTHIGVATVGVCTANWQRLAHKKDLLRLFLRSLSGHLLQCLQAGSQQEQQRDEQARWQQLEIRKIIHEVNNPLSVITNYLYTLSTRLDENHAAGDDIAVIREEITRVGEILARLKEIGRPDRTDGGLLHLNRVIEGLLGLFGDTLFLEHDIRVETDLDEDIPPLSVNTGAVKQILINLLKNAGEAMTAGGTLRVATRDRVYKEGDPHVEVQISDDGPGLPEPVLESLFQPVASSKEDHAGLGLTIVKNLMDGLAGEIFCASHPRTGTRFQILLPRRVEKGAAES